MDTEPLHQEMQSDAKARRRTWWLSTPVARYQIVLALALGLTFIAYAGTLAFQFVYDDRAQIVENPWMRSWHYLPLYFSKQVWGALMPGFYGNYYRPLFLLWLRLNYVFFGLRPEWWHLTNVLCHLGVTLLVYFLARRILNDRMTAALAALIFGVHPVHIEGVAWISGVTEPLMALPFIGSFLCYLRKPEDARRTRLWRALSYFLFLIAMFEKETGVVLPLVIVAYEWIYWPRGKKRTSRGDRVARLKNAFWCSVPYFALLPVYLIARTLALKGFSHTITPLSLGELLLTWPGLIWFYVKLLVWPFNLSPFYKLSYVKHPTFLNLGVPVLALAACALILWVWMHKLKEQEPAERGEARARSLLFAIVWFIVPILPLLDLPVLPKGEFAHDRYMYLPSVGFVMVSALAIRALRFQRIKLLQQPALQVGLAGVVIFFFVLGTMSQSMVWANDLLVYYRGVKDVPNNNSWKINLGNVMAEHGYTKTAMKLYTEVLARNPNSWLANYDVGYLSYRLGRLDTAETFLARAITIDPRRPDQFFFYGLTELKKGKLGEAQRALRRAIKMNPNEPGYHLALGLALKLDSKYPEALKEFKAELAVNPKENVARQQEKEVLLQMEKAKVTRAPSPRRLPMTPSGKPDGTGVKKAKAALSGQSLHPE